MMTIEQARHKFENMKDAERSLWRNAARQKLGGPRSSSDVDKKAIELIREHGGDSDRMVDAMIPRCPVR